MGSIFGRAGAARGASGQRGIGRLAGAQMGGAPIWALRDGAALGAEAAGLQRDGRLRAAALRESAIQVGAMHESATHVGATHESASYVGAMYENAMNAAAAQADAAHAGAARESAALRDGAAQGGALRAAVMQGGGRGNPRGGGAWLFGAMPPAGVAILAVLTAACLVFSALSYAALGGLRKSLLEESGVLRERVDGLGAGQAALAEQAEQAALQVGAADGTAYAGGEVAPDGLAAGISGIDARLGKLELLLAGADGAGSAGARADAAGAGAGGELDPEALMSELGAIEASLAELSEQLGRYYGASQAASAARLAAAQGGAAAGGAEQGGSGAGADGLAGEGGAEYGSILDDSMPLGAAQADGSATGNNNTGGGNADSNSGNGSAGTGTALGNDSNAGSDSGNANTALGSGNNSTGGNNNGDTGNSGDSTGGGNDGDTGNGGDGTGAGNDGDTGNGDDGGAGGALVLTVSLPQAADLYGYQFELRYDPDKYRYCGGLESAIPEIATIFASSFEGRLLVGATMVGERGGVDLAAAPVCRIRMAALEGAEPGDGAGAGASEGGFELQAVGTVDSGMNYTQNVAGWTLAPSAQ
ncbi:MAG: hypothetical protein LBJ10_09715 [Clostridiales bacterium]|nr:hypothetical protein [Clostridiales bacterium]